MFLTCWCLSFSIVVLSETFPSSLTGVSSSPPLVAAAKHTVPFLRLRAGAFGKSNSQDDTENDNDDETSQVGKGKKKKNRGNQRSTTNSNDATVEEYVAAMKERDAGQDAPTGGTGDRNNALGVDDEQQDAYASSPQNSGDSSSSNSPTRTTLTKHEKGSSSHADKQDAKPSVVGVKSHKKSNAVGDPDGDDDDDDDDETETEDESLSEFSEEWEEIEESYDHFEEDLFEPQVEVEVEMVEEKIVDPHQEERDTFLNNKDSFRPTIVASKSSGGGGVGVRLGRMANRRKNRDRRKAKAADPPKPSYDSARLQSAWNPFVYFPPSTSGLSFLSNNARILDASSKSRLDRRTLYAGLLLEWGATESKLSSSTRKFLPASSSQALQAALSMATQPIWRQSAPRTNGIRLYQDSETTKGSTLGMQETIAMSLVSIFLCHLNISISISHLKPT